MWPGDAEGWNSMEEASHTPILQIWKLTEALTPQDRGSTKVLVWDLNLLSSQSQQSLSCNSQTP